MELLSDDNFILLPDEQEIIRGEDWVDSAYCKDANAEQRDLFFSKDKESIRRAKQFCGECAVRKECLDDALWREEPYGVRGGLEVKERKKILKARGE